ncbi:allantoinase AllB [Lentilactobacillus raoultii]|uniref:Allantoinase n=1 Tax=Lentilactobacillus raoultii TaxID=1987503 RepID=A0ABW3PNU0_9LACO|nr:allantoinase AllB [Lentilactobacillus raoultii]
MEYSLVITNGHVATPTGVIESDLAIKDGQIAAIGDGLVAQADHVIDADGQMVLPGMVDSHVHINEPGRSDWEDYRTGSQALAAGGTTTMLVMPLNALPARTTGEEFQRQKKIAETKSYVDFGFYGGLVPGNLAEISKMAEQGAMGYKAFMATTGSDIPGDFKNVTDYQLLKGMQEIGKTGLPILVHAENAAITDGLAAEKVAKGQTDIQDYVDSRPPFVEVEAVKRAIYLASQTNVHLHFVHLSTPEAVAQVTKAKAAGQNVTCETCPHYLILDRDQFEKIGPLAKCSPALRDRQVVEGLWQKLFSGQIDTIGSDHSPAPASMKQSPDHNIFDIWGGISGCQNNVDLLYDQAVTKRGLPVTDFIKLTAETPAKLFGLAKKGCLAVGYDADITLLDLKQHYQLKPADLYYKNKISAYMGMIINDRVTTTILRGQVIYTLKDGFKGQPTGQFLQKQLTGVDES